MKIDNLKEQYENAQKNYDEIENNLKKWLSVYIDNQTKNIADTELDQKLLKLINNGVELDTDSASYEVSKNGKGELSIPLDFKDLKGAKDFAAQAGIINFSANTHEFDAVFDGNKENNKVRCTDLVNNKSTTFHVSKDLSKLLNDILIEKIVGKEGTLDEQTKQKVKLTAEKMLEEIIPLSKDLSAALNESTLQKSTIAMLVAQHEAEYNNLRKIDYALLDAEQRQKTVGVLGKMTDSFKKLIDNAVDSKKLQASCNFLTEKIQGKDLFSKLGESFVNKIVSLKKIAVENTIFGKNGVQHFKEAAKVQVSEKLISTVTSLAKNSDKAGILNDITRSTIGKVAERITKKSPEDVKIAVSDALKCAKEIAVIQKKTVSREQERENLLAEKTDYLIMEQSMLDKAKRIEVKIGKVVSQLDSAKNELDTVQSEIANLMSERESLLRIAHDTGIEQDYVNGIKQANELAKMINSKSAIEEKLIKNVNTLSEQKSGLESAKKPYLDAAKEYKFLAKLKDKNLEAMDKKTVKSGAAKQYELESAIDKAFANFIKNDKKENTENDSLDDNELALD